MADIENFDTPLYTAYSNWDQAKAAVVQVFPVEKNRANMQVTLRIIQRINGRVTDLNKPPASAQIATWHDGEGLNLLEINEKLEDRKAEAELWSWVSFLMLQHVQGGSTYKSKPPKSIRALSLVDKVIHDLRAFYTYP